jgi:hypothetical protein
MSSGLDAPRVAGSFPYKRYIFKKENLSTQQRIDLIQRFLNLVLF